MVRNIHRHFRKVDPKIAKVLAIMELELLVAETNGYFAKLCRDIISQQLGSGAAHAIHGRFLNLFPRKKGTPTSVLKFSEQQLRNTGMSWAKARYVRSLAEAVYFGKVRLNQLHKLSDEEVIAELTKVKGIGRWTAEMFLMFTLGREDVFSHGDIGLRRGLELLHGKAKTRTPQLINSLTERWSPYRTYACLALWHAKDTKAR